MKGGHIWAYAARLTKSADELSGMAGVMMFIDIVNNARTVGLMNILGGQLPLSGPLQPMLVGRTAKSATRCYDIRVKPRQ